RCAVVERQPPHVDVVRRLLAAREGEIAVEDRLVGDETDEGLAVGLDLGRAGGSHGDESTDAPHLARIRKKGRCFTASGRLISTRRPGFPYSLDLRSVGHRHCTTDSMIWNLYSIWWQMLLYTQLTHQPPEQGRQLCASASSRSARERPVCPQPRRPSRRSSVWATTSSWS